MSLDQQRLDFWVSDHLQRVIDVRHDIHAHPELGFDTPLTCHAIATELRSSGLEPVQTRGGMYVDIGPSPVDEALAADLALPIEDLEFTVRSYNCLKREGIHTVGELITRSEQDLLDIRNFGSKSIDEVKAKLSEMGLDLKDSPEGFDPDAVVDAFDDDVSFAEDEQY